MRRPTKRQMEVGALLTMAGAAMVWAIVKDGLTKAVVDLLIMTVLIVAVFGIAALARKFGR